MKSNRSSQLIAPSRSAGLLTYPANFILVGSMYPCPCGFYTDPEKECACSISVEVPRVPFEKLSDKRTGEPSTTVRERVEAARTIQRERFAKSGLHINADMGPGEIGQFCPLDETSTNLVKSAMQQMQLSARAYHRILKLARYHR